MPFNKEYKYWYEILLDLKDYLNLIYVWQHIQCIFQKYKKFLKHKTNKKNDKYNNLWIRLIQNRGKNYSHAIALKLWRTMYEELHIKMIEWLILGASANNFNKVKNYFNTFCFDFKLLLFKK